MTLAEVLLGNLEDHVAGFMARAELPPGSQINPRCKSVSLNLYRISEEILAWLGQKLD